MPMLLCPFVSGVVIRQYSSGMSGVRVVGLSSDIIVMLWCIRGVGLVV